MNPAVEILDSNETYVRFKLSNVDVAVANSLRRTMIAEVESLAISTVFIINLCVLVVYLLGYNI